MILYHNDHLGTPQKLTASNGAVAWSAKYESFGKAVVEVDTVENNLRFPGQYFDGESGLHYNYHRYYDPELGRYLRRDPVGFWGGQANLYGYVWNNPLYGIDPHGEFIFIAVAAIAAMGGGEAVAALTATVVVSAAIIWYAAQDSDGTDWRDRVDYDDWPFGQEYFYPDDPDPNEENRQNAEEECFSECEPELGGDPCEQGFGFSNCMKECMGRKGFSYP